MKKESTPKYVSPPPAEKRLIEALFKMDNGWEKIRKYFKQGYRSIIMTNEALKTGMISCCMLSRNEMPYITYQDKTHRRHISIRKLMKDRYKFKTEYDNMMEEQKQKDVRALTKAQKEGFKKGEICTIAAGSGVGKSALYDNHVWETPEEFEFDEVFEFERKEDLCNLFVKDGKVVSVDLPKPATIEELVGALTQLKNML